MHYEGPIYRPPSEADSLLIQATVGCPHNKCTFCMVYKDGVPFKIRATDDIKADLAEAREIYGDGVRTIFFPAGNTIAMPTTALAEICRYSHTLFPAPAAAYGLWLSPIYQAKRFGKSASAGPGRVAPDSCGSGKRR